MLKSFLNFDNFITPRIITIIYWMQIVAVFFIAFNVMFSGIGAEIGYAGHGSFYRPSFTFLSFLLGIFTFVAGVLTVRIPHSGTPESHSRAEINRHKYPKEKPADWQAFLMQ